MGIRMAKKTDDHRDQPGDPEQPSGLTVWVEEEWGYRHWRWETSMDREGLARFWRDHLARDPQMRWNTARRHGALRGRLEEITSAEYDEAVMNLPDAHEVVPTKADRNRVARAWLRAMGEVPESWESPPGAWSEALRYGIHMARVEANLGPRDVVVIHLHESDDSWIRWGADPEIVQ